MASIRKRPRSDGTTYAVLFTIDRRQTSVPFKDEASAEKFKALVENVGGVRAMAAWGIRDDKRSLAAPTGMTVSEWLDHYIEHLTGVGKSTIYDYRAYARNNINPEIGALPLNDLSGDDISRWVQSLRKKRGGELAGKTVANMHGFLSAALASAVKAGHMSSNPAAGTRLPSTERPDMVFLTHEDFDQLLAEIPEQWKPLPEFLVNSGARFGEVAALRPSDVNRKAGTVRIARAWKRTYTAGGYELGPPKTKRSRRTISVARELLDRLDYTGEWLFTNSGRGARSRGGPVRVSNFRANVWWPAIERAKLDPRPRVHDLRHTCASWLIQAGVPLPVIQRRLGHESIQVTVDVYGHLDRGADEAAAEALGGMLSR